MFVFDNSYSWLHSKEVEYVVEVLDPYGNVQDSVTQQLENLGLSEGADDNKNLTAKAGASGDGMVDVPILEQSK